MDPSLLGVMQTLAVTVRQFEISSGVFSPVVCVWQVFGWKLPGGRVSSREQMLVPPQLDKWSLRRFAVVLFLMKLSNSDWSCEVYKTWLWVIPIATCRSTKGRHLGCYQQVVDFLDPRICQKGSLTFLENGTNGGCRFQEWTGEIDCLEEDNLGNSISYGWTSPHRRATFFVWSEQPQPWPHLDLMVI